MQDLELNVFTPDKRLKEKAFQEFIVERNIQNNSDARLWYLPLILIQFTLTFFSFGLLNIRRPLFYNQWQIPLHLTICIILTSFALGFILAFDNAFSATLGGLVILTINYWTAVVLTRRTIQTVGETKETNH